MVFESSGRPRLRSPPTTISDGDVISPFMVPSGLTLNKEASVKYLRKVIKHNVRNSMGVSLIKKTEVILQRLHRENFINVLTRIVN